MGDFFKGWRRKLGCVALLMACAMMGAWMRSQFTSDVACWSMGHESEVVISSNGMLSWWRLGMQGPVPRFWNPNFVSQGNDGTYYFTVRDWGVELGPADSLSIPYWPFVIPLTFVSAYLILWKPRKAKTSDQPAISNLFSN